MDRSLHCFLPMGADALSLLEECKARRRTPTLPDGSYAHLLVKGLVEGEDLAERLKRGPVPGDEALATARQIAMASRRPREGQIEDPPDLHPLSRVCSLPWSRREKGAGP